MIRFLAIALLSPLLLSGCIPPAPPTSPTRIAPEVGCFAPELEGTDIEGEKIKLSNYRGKVVLVDFWATWCPPCRKMIPQEKELVARMQGRPFVFIGVSADHSRDALTRFLEREPMPWPHLYDGYGGPLARKWSADSLPMFFIIDAHGVIRYRLDMPGPGILEGPVEKLVRDAEGR